MNLKDNLIDSELNTIIRFYEKSTFHLLFETAEDCNLFVVF